MGIMILKSVKVNFSSDIETPPSTEEVVDIPRPTQIYQEEKQTIQAVSFKSLFSEGREI